MGEGGAVSGHEGVAARMHAAARLNRDTPAGEPTRRCSTGSRWPVSDVMGVRRMKRLMSSATGIRRDSAGEGPFVTRPSREGTLRARPLGGLGIAAATTLFAILALPATFALLALPAADAQAYDVPTGAAASPLFGAQPFTQKMLRFEEFGLEPLPGDECQGCARMPAPTDCFSHTPPSTLDAFLAQPLSPFPMRSSNTLEPNPWEPLIEQCVRPLDQTAIEGRPPGEWYSHQRWGDFLPKRYFQTATRGARRNEGLRDGKQRHQWSVGEFGPGGLYHAYDEASGAMVATCSGLDIRFHPNMPIQDPDALWTFDGTLPPKLLVARYGFPILFRHYNGLPIDPASNYGFGAHTLSTHEHNGHNPAESDGYTASFFFPGQFYDYRWPMILAGHDHINTAAMDYRAATPDGAGGTIKIPGDWRETMSTHWFHDHMFDFTAQNVYKGSAAMMNYYSAVDRGNEAIDCHHADPANNVNLCLPSGTGLDWGNRDYDVNLLIADKAWDTDGQLFFNIFNLDGFVADRMTVNWLYKPYLEVRARRYRLRLLNGSVSRYIKVAIVDEAGRRVPFHLIANDGNLMEHAVRFVNQDLPLQAIAERYDIIIDFAQFQPGQKLYMINRVEHQDGKGPEDAPVPLGAILNGSYEAQGAGLHDPAVGAFLELRVVAYEGQDGSMDPSAYEPGGLKMVPLPEFTAAELAGARHRSFDFQEGNALDSAPWTIRVDDELEGVGADPHRISAAPEENNVEIWHMETGGGWSHPIHVHFEEGQILTRDGAQPPLHERLSRKDVFRIGSENESSREISVAFRFREFLGSYMEHCHNTQHEDHAMLLRYDVDSPGQTVMIPSPIAEWDGVSYEESFALASYKTGDPSIPQPPPGQAQDEDADGVSDLADNCTLVANGPVALDPGHNSQRDTDGDGFGNICDTDINNDGITNFGDFIHFQMAIFGAEGTPTYNAHTDFDGNGRTDWVDLAIFIQRWQSPPGPSGLVR